MGADVAAGSLEGDLEFLMRAARKVEAIRADLGKVGPVIAPQVEAGDARQARSSIRPGRSARRRPPPVNCRSNASCVSGSLACTINWPRRARSSMHPATLSRRSGGLDLAGLPASSPSTTPARRRAPCSGCRLSRARGPDAPTDSRIPTPAFGARSRSTTISAWARRRRARAPRTPAGADVPSTASCRGLGAGRCQAHAPRHRARGAGRQRWPHPPSS